MNILFLSLSRFDDITERGIYSDLMRELIRRGNHVYIASPTERRFGKKTSVKSYDNCDILKIHTLNIQKTNIIEKGIGTLLLEPQFNRAINKYWGDIKFDLVLYATPPITFNKVIEGVKKRYGAKSYLMLKDIFPQNAVDLGMMGSNSPVYKMFRRKEQRLYEISDRIGCMSPANCNYVITHNPEVDREKVELCPNALELVECNELSQKDRDKLLSKYHLPNDKVLSIYGGNLGKPQGVDFLIQTLESNENRKESFILIVGSGTEYGKLRNWFDAKCPKNAMLLSALPKADYDSLIKCADIGLVYLDHRFTIPNFPSRLLSYLENKLPVIIASDKVCDMGSIAEDNGFGVWAESGDLRQFDENLDRLVSSKSDRLRMGEAGYEFLCKNYTVDKVADIILRD